SWPARLAWREAPVTGTRLPAGLAREAARADLVVFFCFEARRFPGQRAALDALRKAAPGRLAAVLLRSPSDLDLLGPHDTALTAHGYRHCQLDALLEALR
ncbi:MAG: hypothetical protein KGL53_06400, partial [Elusimicrobia bacterium]|nr:hypothetical protein [Elusimicrobiota bacterium]